MENDTRDKMNISNASSILIVEFISPEKCLTKRFSTQNKLMDDRFQNQRDQRCRLLISEENKQKAWCNLLKALLITLKDYAKVFA